jgi:hypothetical protein
MATKVTEQCLDLMPANTKLGDRLQDGLTHGQSWLKKLRGYYLESQLCWRAWRSIPSSIL